VNEHSTNKCYVAAVARMKPEDRRTVLLDATVRVIAARGFARTRVNDIAAEAGVSVGLLHRYFPTLDDALAEAFAAVAERELRDLDALRGSPTDQLRLILNDSIHEAEDWITIWIDAWGESLHRPALRDTATRYTQAWRDRLAALFRAGTERGEWRCEDPEDSAARIVACIDGIALHLAIHPPPGGTPAAVSWVRRLLAVELGTDERALFGAEWSAGAATRE